MSNSHIVMHPVSAGGGRELRGNPEQSFELFDIEHVTRRHRLSVPLGAPTPACEEVQVAFIEYVEQCFRNV